MAINPKIKQKAEDIRKKIFGSEVRESLASGIEAISEDVEATIGRQDYVEEQFQNVIDETTDKDVISAPELIAARNGKSNLKTRLDDEHAQVTAQLQQTVEKSTFEQFELSTNQKLAETLPKKTPKMKGINLTFKNDAEIDYALTNLQSKDSAIGLGWDNIVAANVTDVILSPYLIATTTGVRADFTLVKLTELVDKIISLGLKPSLKIHPNKAGGGSLFVGGVVVTDVYNFFSEYKQIILGILNISQNYKLVSITNESPNLTNNHLSHWQSLIAEIRNQNPTIKITQSPTYTELKQDTCIFWESCDYISANIYPYVSNNAVPTESECEKGMYSTLDGFFPVSTIFNKSKKYGKPFILTEIGVRPYEYQTASPSLWEANLGVYNEEVQANFYDGFLKTFLNMDNCAGLFIFGDGSGFTFLGRSAEVKVRDYFGGGN